MSSLAVSIEKAAELSGIGRTRLYDAIKRGSLRARKDGRRTIILLDDLNLFLAALPDAGDSPSSAPEDQRIKSLESQLAFLAGAAMAVVHDSYRIHDTEPWPLKYRAPFGPIANLAQILESLPFVRQLPTARLFLDEYAKARQEVDDENDEFRRRLGLEP
jgi:excisionase family DNA binding protein